MRPLLIVPAVLLLLTGCGGPSFEESDPNGWKACQLQIQANQSSDSADRIGGILAVGKLAIVAESADIRAAAEPLAGSFSMADAEKIAEACQKHGVKVPRPVAVFTEGEQAGMETP